MIKKLPILLILFLLLRCGSENMEDVSDFHRIENGIHVRTGLKDDPNLQMVIGACTPCHSAQLIIQNRATRDGWEGMIRWMQERQGLGNLGESEPIILDYLAKHYAPEEKGRRPNLLLSDEDWYLLD